MKISGSSGLLSLVDFLPVAELNRRNYLIRLTKSGEEGKLAVADGVLCHAVAGNLVGPEAAKAILAWPDSQTEIEPLGPVTPANIPPEQHFLSGAVKALAQTKRPSPDPSWRVSGDLELLSTAEVLQVFELNKFAVQVRLVSEKGAASVFMHEGDIIHAARESSPQAQTPQPVKSPQEIVYDLLSWSGRFEVCVVSALPNRTIQDPVPDLLQEGMRLAEERGILAKERIAEAKALVQKTFDELKEGKASDVVRRFIAKRYLPRGQTAPVNLLMALAQDRDKEVSAEALHTISGLPLVILKTMAGDSKTPDGILRHLVEEFWDDDQLMRAVAENPAATEETLGRLASCASETVLALITKDAARAARSAAIRTGVGGRGGRDAKLKKKKEMDEKKKVSGSIHKRIMELSMSDKIFLASAGTATERAILAQNPVRMIATAVLKSPKITDKEVESLASMKSVSADVLEGISENSQWINQYPITRAVATNPKTPAHIGAELVKRLREMDLKHMQKDHNLPEAVRAAVTRRLKSIELKKV